MQLRSPALALFCSMAPAWIGASCSDREPEPRRPARTESASSATPAAPPNGVTAGGPAKAVASPVNGGDRAPGEAKPDPVPVAEVADGEKLYAQHCALCHGISGDGQGQMKLDPPARSFQSGKFSFGNTPEQLVKTITSGIPGRSPMPAFELILTEVERRAIVKHLATLMPIEQATNAESTEMVVLGKTLFARGLLPALAGGLPVRERGLLVGVPEGLSFEYRVDDVRLLALRLGRFASRRDWGGRGGDALEPLGRVLAAMQGGDPEASFAKSGAPLRAAFRGTWTRGDESIVELELVDAAGASLGRLEERLEVVALRDGTGVERRWSGGGAASGVALDPLGSRGKSATWEEQSGWWWTHEPLEDGTTLVTAVSAGARESGADGRKLFGARASGDANAPAWRQLSMVASVWDATRRAVVAEALAR
ncbi:MAG: cytochrome c [Planctomycetes bacterium]|nr:cytochrome c [Planctomycetota bacterium]